MTKDDATKVVRGEHSQFEVVEEKWIHREKGVDRHWVVIQDKSTQKFYETCYERGFRRSGDSGWDVHPFDREEPTFKEVKLREIVTKEWVEVKQKFRVAPGTKLNFSWKKDLT